MLGLRQRVRALPAAHPSPDPPNRCGLGHGDHAGACRKDLVTRLADVDPVLWPDVVSGARAALHAFETHLSDVPHAEINADAHG